MKQNRLFFIKAAIIALAFFAACFFETEAGVLAGTKEMTETAKAGEGTKTVKILAADTEYGFTTVKGYSGPEDGKAHSISVLLPADAPEATVTYATAKDGVYSANNPSFTTGSGEPYTVYYKVTYNGEVINSGNGLICFTTDPLYLVTYCTQRYVIQKYTPKGGSSNPPSYRKTGYTFEGWFDQPEGGNNITLGALFTPTADTTLYAHWTALSDTIGVPKIASLKNFAKGKVKVTVTCTSPAVGYVVEYAREKAFKTVYKRVIANSSMIETVTKNLRYLKKGKTYYVRVKGYTTDTDGTVVYGAASKVKKVKIKK